MSWAARPSPHPIPLLSGLRPLCDPDAGDEDGIVG
jgi:hypothetical protein